MAKHQCARPACEDTEDRIDGYCSVYCRDVTEYVSDARREAFAEAAKIVRKHCLAIDCPAIGYVNVAISELEARAKGA